MPDNKYAPTSWGSQGATYDFTTPSGQTCLLRRISPEKILATGILKDVDSLSAIAGGHIDKAEGQSGQAETDTAAEILKNPGLVSKTFNVIDKVLCLVVAQPALKMPLTDEAQEAEDGVVYTDMIDLDDKMAIFEQVFEGSNKLQQFRGEASEPVGGMEPLTKSEV